MKRAREGNAIGPDGGKRILSSRIESSGPFQPPSGSQRLTQEDALAYLKAVKDMFRDRKEKYDEFLEVMRDFKAQRINTSGVIQKVKELFKGNRNLILGFNAFLPKGYEISLPPEEEPVPRRQPVEFDQAINYVNTIKTRFQSNEQTYKSFLEILNMYRKGKKSISEVYQEVACLFQKDLDLLEEFRQFLPESMSAALIAPVLPTLKTTGNAAVCCDDKITGSVISKFSDNEINAKKDKGNTTTYCGRILERPGEQEAECNYKVEKDQIKRLEKEKEKREREEHIDTFRGLEDKDSEQEEEKFLERSKWNSIYNADDLVRKQSEARGNTSLRSPVPTSLSEEKMLKSFQKEMIFFENVKTRLRNRESYQDFLKCLNLYSAEIINRAQLRKLIEAFLGKHYDLVEGFNDFLAHCEDNEIQMGEGRLVKTVKDEKECEKEKNNESYREEKHHERDREKERDKFTSQQSKDLSSHKNNLLCSKEKFMNKPISELDLSNCERCTPSYRLLPKNYPKSTATFRTQLGHSVLNDSWVSVTSGSEDYSFKHMRKNQYEESLFRCEDDRFELDMLLESTIVTSKRVEELLEKMQNAKQDPQLQVEEYLTAINLRCVERIYGDHGLDIIDMLRKNAATVLPVIFFRLKQKQEEWSKCKAEMNRVWAEVYAKNYHKSLDHRSFYFKQQDKKNLSTKGLLVEIKEINEKKRKEDDAIISVVTENRRPSIHDLKFDYPDTSINEDLYCIIKHSADEMCTTMEQSDKVMRLWTSFLESMFDVPARPHGAENTEVAAQRKVLLTQMIGSSDADNDGSGYQNGEVKAIATNQNDVKDDMPLLSKDNSSVDRVAIATNVAMNGGLTRRLDVIDNDGIEANLPALEDSSRRLNGLKNKGIELNLAPILKCCSNEAIQSLKVEREEGELSPSPDVEEHHNASFCSMDNCSSMQENIFTGESLKIADLSKDFSDLQKVRESMECNGVPVCERDGDDDEGVDIVQKMSEDTENASEASEEASGSESREGNNHGSHDDNDEEDDDEEGKVESEGEADGMPDTHDEEGDDILPGCSDRSVLTCKPLTVFSSAPFSSIQNKVFTVFYGNDAFYVLFRLHQTLYERILSAKTNAIIAQQKWKTAKESNSPNLYGNFMQVLYNLLDGSADNAKFEDDCRTIIGTQSYVLFTLDKLIFKLVKQLQTIASDEIANKLLALHSYEKSRAAGESSDLVYHANACNLLCDENIYRFEHRKNPNQLFIHLMERGSEKLDLVANIMEFSFSNYLNDFLLTEPDVKHQHGVFLKRNKCQYKDDDEQNSGASVRKNVNVINGLEYKISCQTSKVSYVLDTEDFFHRAKRKHLSAFPESASGNSQKIDRVNSEQVTRFQKWIHNLDTREPDRYHS